MAIEFVNPLTAGTVLVREAIQSQNYNPGSAGWIIEADGDAEFNDVTIRGGTVVSGTALYYDGTPAFGNLILAIAAQAGTDEYGNAYPAGLTSLSTNGTINMYETTTDWQHVNGSRIEISAGGAQVLQQLTPPDVVGVTWDDGAIGTNITSDFGASTPSLFLQSPSDSVNQTNSSITLLGSSPSTDSSRVDISGDVRMLDQIVQYDSDTFSTWTPTISGGGAATFTSRDGFWQRIGKLIFVRVYFVIGTAGSGGSNVTFTLPVTPYRSGTRQNIPGCMRDSGSGNGPVGALVFAGGAGATVDRLVNSLGDDVLGVNLTSGSIWTFEGWIREA